MTQRIFNIENKKDMADLWDILPDFITSVYQKKESVTCFSNWVQRDDGVAYPLTFISLRWHDKTEITRPVNYEDMIGCVGWFKHHKETIDECSFFGILDKYNENDNLGRKFYCRSDTWYEYFTPAKKSELKFWGE